MKKHDVINEVEIYVDECVEFLILEVMCWMLRCGNSCSIATPSSLRQG
jgi:hypothetical protein